MSAGVFHGAEVPCVVISPREHLAAVQPPPCLPVPAISRGFASADWAQPAHGGRVQGRRRALGDSAREPLSQTSQALFQCLHALLQGWDMSTNLRSSQKLGLPSTAAPLPPQPSTVDKAGSCQGCFLFAVLLRTNSCIVSAQRAALPW